MMNMKYLAFALAVAGIAAPALADDASLANADPVAVAKAALERNRPALQCRFAFTLVEKAENQTIWATFDLKRRNRMEFDPRRPIGERWRILAANRAHGDQRRQMNWGARSDPRADLLTLTLEGDVEISELKLQEARPDAWVLSFTPVATGTVNKTSHNWLNQLQGELIVSRGSGEVVGRTLRQVGAFEEGMGRLRTGSFSRTYAAKGPYSFTAATNQDMEMSAAGKRVKTIGEQTITAVTPICDAAEVARIAAMEAAAPQRELSDRTAPTGTRIRR
jgi:hypothetical protein